MINEKTYQDIFDEISKYLLPGWEKLVVYLEYGYDSYSISFYQKINGSYIKCYDLPDVSEKMLFASFKQIDKIIVEERSKEEGEIWTNMTMTVRNTGDMHVDFDYTDLSERAYEYKKEWKKKYLR